MKAAYTIRQVTMTPELAKKLLLRNTKNRPLNVQRVQKYKGLCTNNEWDGENPQGCTTTIDSDDVIVDSQHRLTAISMLTDFSLPWILIENVHPDARKTFDQGRPRSPGDFLASEIPGLKNHQKYAAMAKLVFSIEEGTYVTEPSRDNLLSTFLVFQKEIEWAKAATAQDAVVASAFAWVLSVIPSRREDLDQLAEQVRTGIQCTPTAALIRKTTEKQSGSKTTRSMKKNTNVDRWILCLTTLRLIEAFLDDEQLSRIPYFKENDREGEERVIRRLRTMGKKRPSRLRAVGEG